MPLISVIIPVYNGAKTIQETIESVLNQTESDFELIVINDGSQDSTLDILATITDPRLQIFSYPNAGVSASRNRGISRACGEFIAFLDADDLWTPDKLEAQLKVLQQNPQAAVAYSWTDYIDAESQFLKPASHDSVSGDIYAKLLLGNFLKSGSNVLIRTHALKEVGNFDQTLTHAEDWDMWLRLAARYHFVVVPLTQILYRISTSSACSNLSQMEAGALQVIERAYNRAPASLQYLKKETLGFLYKYLIYKSFEDFVGRQKGIKAAIFFYNYMINDCSRHRLVKLKLSLLSKVMATIILPSHQPKLNW